MKYIDADRLRARIEKYLTFDNSIDTAFYIGRRDAERSILELIESLQQEQPEVDLEDIIRVEFGTRAKVEDGRRFVKLNWDKFSILARHFYELGQQNRPKISDASLEEEIERYEEEIHGYDGVSSADCKNIARHFARWGEGRIKK